MKNLFKYFYLTLIALVSLACTEQEEIPAEDASLAIEPKLVQFEAEAGQQQIQVKASGSWNVTLPEGASWCSLDPLKGQGNTALNVSVEANSESRRSAVFTFKSEGCRNVQLTVIQTEGEGSGGETVVKTGLYAEPEVPDADKACTLYYRADPKSPFYDYSGELYAHIGILDEEWKFVQAEWNQNIDKCKWTKVKDNLWKLEIKPTVREWFSSGENPVPSIAVVVRNAAGTTQTQDLFVKVQDNKYQFSPDEVVRESMPAGVKHGINYKGNEVTFVLYDKDKNGKSYDYCYLIGEFSQWKRQKEYMMKRDDNAGCWWYTMDGLAEGKEYLFQYYLGMKDGKAIRLSDPYSEIIYDGWNDKYISSSTYPGLTAYPSETNGLVSAFEIGGKTYNWKNPDYKIKDKDNLVIYEMLLRDFTSTKDLNGASGKLDYIEKLGVNAIELMPVQEFDGNLSWGYNPNHYFALDKAYGTREMYKKFIDDCHSRNLAVIVDVVYNHVTGLHPMAKMYFEGSATTENNPWFNVEAPHPYSVFHDWNHENAEVREHVKRSLEYLLEEYHVDGFRFDLSKGLTQKHSTESTAGNYDASRIKILKDYHDQIQETNPDAVMILEHFCEQREEKELAENGMKVWRNANNAYCQSAMGYKQDSGFGSIFTGSSMPFGAYVGFMESHDEERTAFKAKKYGTDAVKKSNALRMKREALNAAFFLTVPGPKMIWQFGELGYDISIEEGGRTSEKPLKWEYYNDTDRKGLYDTYADLLAFRRDHPEFFRKDADFSWSVDSNAWPQRHIRCNAGTKSFVVVGNFGDSAAEMKLSLGSGSWKNYFSSKEPVQGTEFKASLQPGEFRLLVNF